MKCSDRGIELIKQFEGYASEPYDDLGNRVTWGYGHLAKTGEEVPKHISEQDATLLLCKDLEAAEACIEGLVDVALTQAQFDALCSFVFNIGCSRFMASTLLRRINARDAGASDEFQKWSRVGQNWVPGLMRRRLSEAALFDSKE